MTGGPTTSPVLDGRDADTVVADVKRTMPAYVPGWAPAPTGPSAVLLRVFGRHVRSFLERLNQAPDKNKLAFLDLVGVNLLPAQEARAPLAFQSRPRMPDSRVPAGSQAGAQAAGGNQIVFQTETDIALAAARLAEVVSLWPGRDSYTDHSADAQGGRPFSLFQQASLTRHEVYFGHDVHFALSGRAKVELQIELAAAGSVPLNVAWEYWDGAVWRQFTAFQTKDLYPDLSFDGTLGLTRSGIIRLAAGCADAARTTVNGVTSYWVRGRVTDPLPPEPGVERPLVEQVKIRTVIEASGLAPDAALADGQKLDVTKPFYPLGTRPQVGSALYVASEEVLTKPGAKVKVQVHGAGLPSDVSQARPTLSWSYWRDGGWQALDIEPTNSDAAIFIHTGTLSFDVPAVMDTTSLGGRSARWLRACLTGGLYGKTISIPLTTGSNAKTIDVEQVEPPVLAPGDGIATGLAFDYVYTSDQDVPQWCVTYNDFQWQDHTGDAQWRGGSFEPFQPVADVTPALYLGFDQPLPADRIGLYFGVVGAPGVIAGQKLRWELWDGTAWSPLAVGDETHDLALPGMVAVLWPGTAVAVPVPVIRTSGTAVQVSDPVQLAQFQPGDLVYLTKGNAGELATVAAVDGDTLTTATPLSSDYAQGSLTRADLPRFGTPRTWIRARLENDGDPFPTRLDSVALNATWATQAQTFINEPLGVSDAQPDQTFFFRHHPVLAGQAVEVCELEGLRAATELPILLEDLVRHGLSAADVRQVNDPRTGRLSQAWVRWQERPNLYFSGPDDRHYVIERSLGSVRFGDGVNGAIPPVGTNGIQAAAYTSGGGQAGNVAKGTITHLLSGVMAQSVSNLAPAEGGADGQPPGNVLVSGPLSVRDRRQAVAPADYEALAREASPAVAVARALPVTDPHGRPAPGWVKLIVVPHGGEARPVPSFSLKQSVAAFISARMPAAAAGRLFVDGPDYLPVGMRGTVVPVDPDRAGPVREAVVAALQAFLHPVTGGPEGRGWPFGRHVYLSDVARVLAAVAGADHLEGLELLLDGTPQGDQVAVAPDRIVVAGQLRITLGGGEA